jgi:hypothetical protein
MHHVIPRLFLTFIYRIRLVWARVYFCFMSRVGRGIRHVNLPFGSGFGENQGLETVWAVIRMVKQGGARVVAFAGSRLPFQSGKPMVAIT